MDIKAIVEKAMTQEVMVKENKGIPDRISKMGFVLEYLHNGNEECVEVLEEAVLPFIAEKGYTIIGHNGKLIVMNNDMGMPPTMSSIKAILDKEEGNKEANREARKERKVLKENHKVSTLLSTLEENFTITPKEG